MEPLKSTTRHIPLTTDYHFMKLYVQLIMDPDCLTIPTCTSNRATVNGGNGNGNGNRKGLSKLQATITLQSSLGEVSLSVVVSNCYLARTVIVILEL